MNVLVFNCGSSSLNARLYEQDGSAEPRSVAIFKAQNVQTKTSAAPKIHWRIDDLERSQTFPALTHHDAAAQVLRLLEEQHLAWTPSGTASCTAGTIFKPRRALKKTR
jgi:acetate kinase